MSENEPFGTRGMSGSIETGANLVSIRGRYGRGMGMSIPAARELRDWLTVKLAAIDLEAEVTAAEDAIAWQKALAEPLPCTGTV